MLETKPCNSVVDSKLSVIFCDGKSDSGVIIFNVSFALQSLVIVT